LLCIHGACPKCFNQKVFKKFLELNDKCKFCGLDFHKINIGDAAIWFSMFLTSIILGAGVLLLEMNFHPSFYIHILVWIPLTVLFSIIFLRFFKYLFIYLYFKGKN